MCLAAVRVTRRDPGHIAASEGDRSSLIGANGVLDCPTVGIRLAASEPARRVGDRAVELVDGVDGEERANGSRAGVAGVVDPARLERVGAAWRQLADGGGG